MNIVDFLNDPIFSFPIKEVRYFPDNLKKTFEKYLILLKSVDDENSKIVFQHLSTIENTCDRINTIADAFFQGRLSKSYEEFAILISHLEQYLMPQNKNYISLEDGAYLFKARKVLEKTFTARDMFHVPFEKRYTIKTNRFSISGLPCLYLSNSIYTCWEELDRPLFSQMAVSRFNIKGKSFKYLDLSINQRYLIAGFTIIGRGENKDHFEFINNNNPVVLEKFIHLFPLYVACYTCVFSKEADFKPEYIFPQMLMQWVANSDDIDGVIYESTKANELVDEISSNEFDWMVNFPGHLNYAIPVKSNHESGICNVISNNFRLTKPTSWEIENIIKPSIINDAAAVKTRFYSRIPSPPITSIRLGNKSTNYYETAFGRLEDLLFLKPLIDL